MLKLFKVQKKFAVVVGLFQVVFIVLYGLFVEYDASAKPPLPEQGEKDSENYGYIEKYFSFFQDIHAMIFFGIGFLYAFMKKYGYSGVSMCMLLAAITIETSLITQNVWDMKGGKIRLNIVSLILSDFAVASSLIALGGVFGKVSPLQMVIFVFCETIFYTVNEHWCFKLLQVRDAGESVALHLFAALFGLSVAFVVDRKKRVTNNPNESSSYTSNLFCILGTVFLWAFWPSFNSALSSGDAQDRSALNTFLALVASCVTAFIASSYLNKEQKFSMTHIQNATLAGGVIIGTVTDLMIQPAGALAIGSLGGIISVIGFIYVTPFLKNYLKVYDPCGINSLHAIPGVLSGIAGAVVALTVSQTTYGYTLYELYPAMAPKANTTELLVARSFLPSIEPGVERTQLQQAGYQLIYVVMSIVISVLSGLLTGVLLRSQFFEPLNEDDMYIDEVFWEMPLEKLEDCCKVKCESKATTKF